MSVVAVAVVLAALVILLLRTDQLKVGSALLCVLLGLVLGATPAGPAINEAVNGAGAWLWAQVTEL
jgi:cell division protein FtsW (lipid II flippase)